MKESTDEDPFYEKYFRKIKNLQKVFYFGEADAHGESIIDIFEVHSSNKLITISKDKSVAIWDANNLKLIDCLIFESEGELSCVNFSQKKEILLIGTQKGEIIVISCKELKIKKTLSAYPRKINEIIPNDKDNEFICCAFDRLIKIYDSDHFNLKHELNNGTSKVIQLVIDDGRNLLIAKDGGFNIWDMNEREEKYSKLSQIELNVLESGMDDQFIGLSGTHKIYLWNYQEFENLKNPAIKYMKKQNVQDLKTLPEKEMLLIMGDKKMELWKLPELDQNILSKKGGFYPSAISRDESLIYSIDNNTNDLTRLATENLKILDSINLGLSSIQTFTITDAYLICSFEGKKGIYFFSLEDLRLVKTIRPNDENIIQLMHNSRKNILISLSYHYQKSLEIYDIDNEKVLFSEELPNQSWIGDISPNGNILITSFAENEISIRDSKTFNLIQKIPNYRYSSKLQFSDNDTCIFAKDEKVTAWNVINEEEEFQISLPENFHKDLIDYFLFSKKQNKLVLSLSDNSIYVWNIENDKMEKRIEFGDFNIQEIQFYQDFPLVVAKCTDNCIRLLNLEKEIIEFEISSRFVIKDFLVNSKSSEIIYSNNHGNLIMVNCNLEDCK